MNGHAWKTGGKWYLLRALDDELVIQVGPSVLRLRDVRGITITAEPRRLRRVRVEGAGQRLEVTYRSPADRVWNRLDPTFDGLDEQLTDFFVRVAHIWESSSKGRELVDAWGT